MLSRYLHKEKSSQGSGIEVRITHRLVYKIRCYIAPCVEVWIFGARSLRKRGFVLEK